MATLSKHPESNPKWKDRNKTIPIWGVVFQWLSYHGMMVGANMSLVIGIGLGMGGMSRPEWAFLSLPALGFLLPMVMTPMMTKYAIVKDSIVARDIQRLVLMENSLSPPIALFKRVFISMAVLVIGVMLTSFLPIELFPIIRFMIFAPMVASVVYLVWMIKRYNTSPS